MITNLYPNPYQPQRATYNRQHFAALAKFHQVKVVAPISWVDEARARLRGGDKLISTRCRQGDGIQTVHPRYYYSPGIFRSQYGQFLLRSIRRDVIDIAKDFQPDVLLGSWAYPDGYATVQLARQMKIPAAVQVLGSDVNLLDRYPARARRTWDTLRSADAVITVSQDLANHVLSHGVDSQRVSVVYGGVDRELFFPGSQQDAQVELNIASPDPMLLFVGNLVPVKAVDSLLTACSILAASFPRMQCFILGDGPLRKPLQSQVAALSLEKQVCFQGVMDHRQLPTWYRAADLVVLPSLAEGVPNVLLESIACGRPYVASRVGGIPEISEHAGCVLVAPGDPQSLADAIARKLRDATAPTPADLPAPNWDASAHRLGQVLENCCRTRS